MALPPKSVSYPRLSEDPAWLNPHKGHSLASEQKAVMLPIIYSFSPVCLNSVITLFPNFIALNSVALN